MTWTLAALALVVVWNARTHPDETASPAADPDAPVAVDLIAHAAR